MCVSHNDVQREQYHAGERFVRKKLTTTAIYCFLLSFLIRRYAYLEVKNDLTGNKKFK